MADKISYFVLGLGVGLTAGVLFAPKSGQETRGLLKTKAGEGKDYLKRRGSELKESAGEIIDKGREMVSRQRENLSEALEAGKQAYRETVNETPAEGTKPA